MKRHRFSLAIAFLLPTLLLIALGEVGVYLGGYFVLRDTANETAIRDDREDLDEIRMALSNDGTLDGETTVLGYALTSIIRAYEAHKPATLPAPGSQEEKDYFRSIVSEGRIGQLYMAARNRFQRYVTDFIVLLYEDTAAHRMVAVCTSDENIGDPEIGPESSTSLYLGAFFDKSAIWNGDSFYGETIRDAKIGDTFASAHFINDVVPIPDDSGDGPYPVWVMRQTRLADVYAVTPRFRTQFAIVASIVLAAMTIAVFVLTQLLFIRPLKRLSKQGSDYVSTLKEGKAEGPFALSSGRIINETTDLNDALYFTQEAIVDYAAQVKESAAYEERIKAELSLAEKLQSSMVPSAPLIGSNYLLRGHMNPAKEVGGDLYNFFQIDDTHVGFFIGDVSGKGVPAALFMAKANALLRLSLKDFSIEEANDILCEDNQENYFVTAFLATLDTVNGELTYVNCGHEPVFLYHDGVYAELEEESNFMLGCIEEFPFVIQKKTLVPGDRLFLYTDGVSEAMNEEGELFGKKRILDSLNAHAGRPSAIIFQAMQNDVKAFVGQAEQSDDACMVALDYCKENTLSFPCDHEGLTQVAPFVDEFLKGKPASFISEVQVILDEICANVVSYSGGEEEVLLILEDFGTSIRGTIVDAGAPFNPLEEGPTERDEDAPGGLGILMVQSMTDDMQYLRYDGHNILSFDKKIEV